MVLLRQTASNPTQSGRSAQTGQTRRKSNLLHRAFVRLWPTQLDFTPVDVHALKLKAKVGLVSVAELNKRVMAVGGDPRRENRIARLLYHTQGKDSLVHYVQQQLLSDPSRNIPDVQFTVDFVGLSLGHGLDRS